MGEGEKDITNLYENLPDNSRTAKAERINNSAPAHLPSSGSGVRPAEKRAEKVVHGKVTRKKNEVRRLTDIFISEDVANVKDYIVFDVLVPTIKKAIYDMAVNSLDMTLFGGRGGKRPTADRYSYKDYNSASSRDTRNHDRIRSSIGYSYDDITLETRSEAEAVLSRLDEIMESYEVVRVLDLYDIVGITSQPTDQKYGWHDIRSAEIVRTRSGYKLKMPRVTPV